MPPELLAVLNSDARYVVEKLPFDLYKQGDMYSFSLVMWEIMNRCRLRGMIFYVVNIKYITITDTMDICFLVKYLLAIVSKNQFDLVAKFI